MANKNQKTEYLSEYIARIEKALERVEDHDVIVSTDVPAPILGSGNVKRVPILWPLYQHTMFYITTLEAGARVAAHSHRENIFRYVIDGSMTITVGTEHYEVSKGMWIAIRAGTEYSVATKSNPGSATFMSAYQVTCQVG